MLNMMWGSLFSGASRWAFWCRMVGGPKVLEFFFGTFWMGVDGGVTWGPSSLESRRIGEAIGHGSHNKNHWWYDMIWFEREWIMIRSIYIHEEIHGNLPFLARQWSEPLPRRGVSPESSAGGWWHLEQAKGGGWTCIQFWLTSKHCSK